MKKVLIVVDMQNDFIDGALGSDEALLIVRNVKAKISQYNVENIYVTRDTHQSDYLSTYEGRNLPVEHCIEGSYGWEIRDDIAEMLIGAHVINKPTFGSYELVGLMVELCRQDPDLEIEMVGLCTDICVVSNALLLRAALPDNHISVDSRCCAGVTPEKHQAALITMCSCQIDIL